MNSPLALPLVKVDTPLNAPNSIELELLSNLVADYTEVVSTF